MTIRIAVCLIGAFAVGCINGEALAQGVQGDIGFSSPAAALQALKARSDVEFSEQNGWTVATDRKNQTVWLFARQGDPAYPTAVKRAPTQTARGWIIGSRIMCGGTQSVCDKVAAEFAN